MSFDVSGATYAGYLDDDRDGAFNQSAAETQALNAFGAVTLPPDVKFGRGSVGPVPGDVGSGAVTFTNTQVEFDTRGITQPFGTRGAVYFVHKDDDTAVSAVSVSGSASFKLWVYRGGIWQ